MKIYDYDAEHIDYVNAENNRLIGEIPFSPDLYEVFKIDGDYYTLGMVAADKSYGGAHKIKQLDLDADATTEYEDNIICPVCGHKDLGSWEFDEGDEYQCGLCGADLAIDKDVSITYSASVVTLPNVRSVSNDE